jgi:hypothetical protein
MLFFNFNTISFVLLAALVAYGIVLGENRLRLVSLGGILALFVVSQIPTDSLDELARKGIFGIHPTPTQFDLFLLGLILALFALGAMLSVKKAQNKIRSFILAIVSALCIVCFSIVVLPDSSRTQLTTDYNLAAMAYAVRYYSLLAFAIWTVITMFVVEKDDRHKK